MKFKPDIPFPIFVDYNSVNLAQFLLANSCSACANLWNICDYQNIIIKFNF